MAAVDPAVIAARVGANGHRPADDPDVLESTNAAIIMVAVETGLADLDPPDVPGDPLTSRGLVGLATRLFVDQYAPNGSTVAVGDPSFDPSHRSNDPYDDWRVYFDRLAVSWGIA
jgi:hypothetical protein